MSFQSRNIIPDPENEQEMWSQFRGEHQDHQKKYGISIHHGKNGKKRGKKLNAKSELISLDVNISSDKRLNGFI